MMKMKNRVVDADVEEGKRCYSELIKLPTYEERFLYLKMTGQVGIETFGFERYLNQTFYKSEEWKKVRRQVIIRDNGCDMADDTHPINGRIIIHHMNPITEKDILRRKEDILDPEFLICVSLRTHNAIHYGKKDYAKEHEMIVRKPNDTCPWKM
ncbi:MAG: hypothetical protein IJ115_06230 [Erysipelotrichaceae bacterium]|nr:hypothetical protein [Erysipelotrichaceae bacterium]